jgi:hypothetical protein
LLHDKLLGLARASDEHGSHDNTKNANNFCFHINVSFGEWEKIPRL